MSYLIATGLLASNCLDAMQRVPRRGSRDNGATSTCAIDWLPDWRLKETRYVTYTYRTA
jgi:hypothetical protein